MPRIRFSQSKIIEEEERIPSPPQPTPLSRSVSSCGLSSLSKGIIEHETKLCEVNDIIAHMKEIIGQYQTEIHCLQECTKNQELLIEEQKNELIQARDDIQNLLKEIHNIWNS
jgi:septal ring factor EnvC (AmiA/AmiB activator)